LTQYRLHSKFITMVHHERRVWLYIVLDQWDVLGRHGVGYALIIRQPLLYEDAVLPSWPIWSRIDPYRLSFRRRCMPSSTKLCPREDWIVFTIGNIQTSIHIVKRYINDELRIVDRRWPVWSSAGFAISIRYDINWCMGSASNHRSQRAIGRRVLYLPILWMA